MNDAFWKWFKGSKIVDKDGNPLVCYHGTPNAGFEEFKPMSHFTKNKDYADVYQGRSASSIQYKPTADNPQTYEVYLSIKNPFDTRDRKAREIYLTEYEAYYSPDLTDKGMVDWMEAEDLIEWLKENHPEYDGLFADEGATGGYDMPVQDRGISIIPFNPNQIKSVDNKGTWSSSNNIYEDWLDDIDFGDISLDDLDLSVPEPEPEVKVDYTEHWVVLDKSVINDNFAKWWGNSYCCNSKGEPIVVYHSTNAEFDTFKSLDGSANGRPVYGGGFCFSAYEDYTKDFGKNTMACVLSIQKPLDLSRNPKLSLMTTYKLMYKDDWEKYYNDPDHVSRGYLESKTESVTSCFQLLNNDGYSFKEIMVAYGYDGIIDGHVFIVVRPNQIKSINNKGTWSKTSDNIYENLNRELRKYL